MQGMSTPPFNLTLEQLCAEAGNIIGTVCGIDLCSEEPAAQGFAAASCNAASRS